VPRTSVVICSYNQAQYLEHAIKSVLEQTCEDLELVIVDNGSSDDSHAIIERYRSHPKVGALILGTENIAITKRLNQAIAKTRGEFISLLYSDDYYLPNKIKSQIALFDKLGSDVGIVHSPGYRLNASSGEQWLEPALAAQGQCLRQILTARGLYMNPIAPLYRRACFETYPFDEQFFVEGEGIMIRMAIRYAFHFDSEPTVVMRDHASNIGRAIRSNGELGIVAYEKLGRMPDFPADAQDALNALFTNHYRSLAWQGIRVVHDRSWARSMAVGALRRDRRLLSDPKIVATLALSVAPEFCMTAFNAVIDRVRKRKSHVNHVVDTRPTSSG
jgi:glycosyltransferase involved in cell wall biosynthesis